MPPEKGGRASKTRGNAYVVCACPSASPSVAPAGNSSADYGGRSVEALCLPALYALSRFSSHVSARHLCVAATVCPARGTAMTSPDFPRLHPHRSSATGGGPPEHAAATDPNAFIATLHRIGKGAAADGQPWPERHQMPGRCMALADADCALAGQRVTLELLLAAERVRQNGTEAEYVGDRVMEGLILACLTMNAQASARMQPEG